MKKYCYIILVLSIFLISCKHQCEYELKYDNEFHYKECSCGSIIEEEKHEYSNEIIKEPTCTEEGINKNKCKICNYEFNENIDKIDHNYELKYNDEMHYKKCSCGSIIEEENHTYEWIIDINSTDLEDGYMHEQCINCNSKKNENTIIEKKCTLEQVKDEELINKLFEYNYYYQYSLWENPPYRLLWDGELNKDNYYDGYYVEEGDRVFFTYLIEYQQKDEGYYLLYLNKDLAKEYREIVKGYSEQFTDFSNLCFSYYNKYIIIDGKYSYCHYRESGSLESIKVLKAKTLDEVKLYLDDYQLVFCAESKKAIIKENLSTGEIINNEMTIFKRCFIEFDKNGKNPICSDYENITNSYLIKKVEKQFDYEGLRIEINYKDYEEAKYDCFPKKRSHEEMVGFISAEITNINGTDYVILPKYDLLLSIDLLLENSKLNYDNDVFGSHKGEFLDAYFQDYNKAIILHYNLALYEYDKVKEIIKENK